MTLDEIPTPALLVDLDRFDANLATLADFCRRQGCRFRPHAKTHKSPAVAQRLVAAGAVGISVATVAEAEAMARAGLPGVLLTSPVIEPAKIDRLLRLVQDGGDLLVTLSHPLQVARFAAAARRAGVTLPVLIDLDTGDHRTGVAPGQPALDLAREIARHDTLALLGVQAYSGSASHVVGREARAAWSRAALEAPAETRRQLERAGYPVGIFTGTSTGTWDLDPAASGVTEIQAGSFAFMDLDYRRIGGRGGSPTFDDFAPSLTVLTTVIHDHHADRVTVDAGIKAFATDVPWPAEARDRPGLAYRTMGDEFGIVTATAGPLPKLGERLEFYVPHCDPTVNLYDRTYALRGGTIEAVWPVVRGR